MQSFPTAFINISTPAVKTSSTGSERRVVERKEIKKRILQGEIMYEQGDHGQIYQKIRVHQ